MLYQDTGTRPAFQKCGSCIRYLHRRRSKSSRFYTGYFDHATLSFVYQLQMGNIFKERNGLGTN